MSISDKLTEIAENAQKVYDAGKKAELLRFWGMLQDNGNRRSYTQYAFSSEYWNDETFNPQFDFIIEGVASSLFRNIAVTDLKAKFEKIIFDTSKATNLNSFLAAASITTAPAVSIEGITVNDGAYYTFGNCSKLHTIEKVIAPANGGCQNLYYLIYNCPELKEVRFEGVFDRSMNISHSVLLSKESLKNIISHLKDFTGTDKEFSYTLTLSSASANLLDGESVTIDGLSWREYMTNICWNVAA